MKTKSTTFAIASSIWLFSLSLCLGASLSTDSLERAAANAKSDTDKVKTLIKLSGIYSEHAPEMAILSGNQALFLSTRINYKVGQIKSNKAIGYAYYMKEDYKKAIEKYESALYIATANKNKLEIYYITNTIGDFYFDQNNFSESFEFHNAAIKQAEEIGRKDLEIEPINFIAAGLYAQAEYDGAYKYYLDALQICQKRNDKKNSAMELLNIGSIFFTQNDYDKALNYYNDALKINQDAGEQDETAKCLNNIGVVYEMKKDYDKAIEFYKRAYDIKIKGKDVSGIINSLTNIGNSYALKKDYDSSIKYYQEALDLSEKDNNKDGMAKLQINIGELYDKKGQPEDAILYIKNGLSISEQIRLNDYKRIGYQELSAINSKLGDYKLAYENHILYSNIKDTILNDKHNKNLAELQTKYETKQKEEEIKLQQDKIEKEAFARNSFIVGCLFLILIVLLLFNRYRIKQKSNEKLTSMNAELEQSNKIISNQSLEIDQNIHYAQNIQKSLLPDMNDIKDGLPESFILYIPKAIVSGDFYWYKKCSDGITISAIDCTGHGVSGAFMSVMAANILFQIDKSCETNIPSDILETLHENIRASLKQKSSSSRDGMDAAVCKFSKDMKSLQYAGAMRPLYHVRDNQLTEIKPDKCSIGGYQEEEKRQFHTNKIDLKSNDCVYIFSDGYADQFGGSENKKFMTKRLKDLLISVSSKPINEQKTIIEQVFKDWKGEKEQIDDILIIGVKA